MPLYGQSTAYSGVHKTEAEPETKERATEPDHQEGLAAGDDSTLESTPPGKEKLTRDE